MTDDAFRTEYLTVGGYAYTLDFFADDDPERPFENDAWVTTIVETRDARDSRYGEIGTIETAKYMREQASAYMRKQGSTFVPTPASHVRDAWDAGHSEAAIVRWLKLRGCTGVHTFTRRYEGELSLNESDAELGTDHEGRPGDWNRRNRHGGDRSSQCDGFVFIPPAVAEANLAGASYVDEAVALEVGQLNAWITGDVFWYRLTHDETGNEVGSCGGYFGFDQESEYVRSEATAEAEYASSLADWLDAVHEWEAAQRDALLAAVRRAHADFAAALGNSAFVLAAAALDTSALALAAWVEAQS